MKKLVSIVMLFVMLLTAGSILAVAEDNYNSIFSGSQPVQTKEYKQKFWDVDKTHWAFDAIAELTDRGAINGYSDGSFKPQNTVTRAEWAKIMIQAAGLSANDYTVRFTDMDGHWATPYVNAAANYLTAFSDNSYRPDQATTREDVTMAMVKLKGYDLGEVDYSVLSKFNDVASISNSMKVYVAIAVEKGLINGFEDGTFRGQATLTRAEAATLLWRAFQFGNDNKTTASNSTVDINSQNNNTDTPVNNGNQTNNSSNATVLTVGDLNGLFWDKLSSRANMVIEQKEDIYKIDISWSGGMNIEDRWFFDAKLDKSTGNLVYQNGYYFTVTYNEDGTLGFELNNDKCEGAFHFEGSQLVWNDYTDDLSKKCIFEKSDESYEINFDTRYADATRELQKYLKVCAAYWERSINNKEEKISKQYHQTQGMLLRCFGYQDSDELLFKLNAVHNIALKLPESICTIQKNINTSVFSFSNCSTSMRDTKLFVEARMPFQGSSTELSLNFTYDYQKFNAKINNTSKNSENIRLIVSLFADNYKDSEFERLLTEEHNVLRATNFEMYYGGYNLNIIVEPASHGSNITVTGEKGEKKITDSTKKTTVTDDSIVVKPTADPTVKKEQPSNSVVAKPTPEPSIKEEQQTTQATAENTESNSVSNAKYVYKRYYAEYTIDENNSGAISTYSKNSVLRHIQEENATLKGEIQVFEKTFSEYQGDSFLDEDSTFYYYLEEFSKELEELLG